MVVISSDENNALHRIIFYIIKKNYEYPPRAPVFFDSEINEGATTTINRDKSKI